VEAEGQDRAVQSERNEEIERLLEKLYARPHIIDPNILENFIQVVHQELSLKVESFKISYANRFIREDETLMDVLGRTVDAHRSMFGQQILLLLDPFPGGNWSHPCLIGTWMSSMKQIEVVTNDFPPSQRDFKMVFSGYLQVDHLLAYAS
jgi:hypothetical protein